MTTTLAIALLIATNLAACLMAWYCYCNMRQAESLAQEFVDLAESWCAVALSHRKQITKTTRQRREAGRKGGLATAATKARIRQWQAEFDALNPDYPAALDEARRA